MPPKRSPTPAPTYASVMQSIKIECTPQDRTRMIARLLEHQTLDTWMTYELMEAAIKWVELRKPNEIDWKLNEVVQTRDQQSSTTADLLRLIDSPADSFYNFQGIKIDGVGDAAMRHINRPDGMFLVSLHTTNQGPQDMVLFYEGEAHGKDVGKTIDSGCKNSHKMYQAIAQAQSKNRDMAGCAIFAAMEYAPMDQVIPFLDDMYKAHIFICIAIADWNSHIHEPRRKTTLISDLFRNSLQYNIQYDFVFGINIGLKPGTPGWVDTDVRDRIDKMRRGLGHAAAIDDIQLVNALNGVAPFSKTSTTIGCVQIVVCAIPRPKGDILTNGNIGPMFIYPHHLGDKVIFDRNKTATGVTNFLRVLDHTGFYNLFAGYNFKTNMMRVTAVHNANIADPDVHKCRLSETTGFFYVALPLAYYTIQQFEFVNAVLEYSWSPTKTDFRLMLRTFKANKKNLTGDLKVTLFAKKKGSLFHVLCKSADDLEPLSEDFDFFLKDCCRWSDPDVKAPRGSSPKIVFRTLGVFSLQNAIDFACEIQANPSKTYSSLLASYPPGAQMLIQQCMKKLSGNEAYAYIGRNAESDKEIRTTDEVREDDETKNSLVNRVLGMENAVIRLFYHSLWSVTIGVREPVAAGEDPAPESQIPGTVATAAASKKKERDDVLALKLLKAYQTDVVCWSCRVMPGDEVHTGDNAYGENPENALLVLWTDCLKQRQLMGGTETIPLQVPAGLYEPNVGYAVTCTPRTHAATQDYLCTPACGKSLMFASDVDDVDDKAGAEYTTNWGRTPITFKLISRTVTDKMKQDLQSAAQEAYEYVRKYLFENVQDQDAASEMLLQIQGRQAVLDADAAAAAAAAADAAAEESAAASANVAATFRLTEAAEAARLAALARPP